MVRATAYTAVFTIEADLDAWDESDAEHAMELIADEIKWRIKDAALTRSEPKVIQQELNVSAVLDRSI